MIAEQIYRRRTVSWTADWEQLVVQRGDVVMLSHDVTQWGYSGRLFAGSRVGNAYTLELDRPVPRAKGQVYHVAIRPANGVMILGTSVPATADGDTDTISVILDDEVEPTRDWIWFYSALPTPGKLVKIVSIAPDADGTARITAMDEDEAYYLAEHNAPGAAITPSTTGVYPKLDNIRIGESAINATTYRVTVFWTLRDAVGASLKWRTKSATATEWGGWETQRVVGTSKSLTMAKGTRIQVRATPVPLAGLVGETYSTTGASYVAA